MFKTPILLLLLVAAPAFAGEPLITDDPGVADEHTFELKIAYSGERNPSGWTHEIPNANLEYGFYKDMSATLEVPFLLSDPENGGANGALGATALEFKWNFLHTDDVGFELSIAPKIQFENPTGVQRGDLLNDGTEVILPMQIGRSFKPWEVFAELGYEFVQYEHNAVDAGIAVGYFVTDKFELLAEIHTDTNSYFDDSSPVMQLGFTWGFTDDLTLLAAAGRSLRSGDEDATFLTYIGLQWDF